MSWEFLGELAKGIISSAGYGAVINRWMEIENPSILRYTIRNDIRDYQSENVEIVAKSLSNLIRQYSMIDQPKKRDQAIIVKETFMEEAERFNLL